MNFVNRVKNYIKNNKLYVTVMIIGIIAFAVQMRFVIPYADILSINSRVMNRPLVIEERINFEE